MEEVIIKDYPECNAIRSYPFVRVATLKNKPLGDFYTVQMAIQAAKLNNWKVTKILHIKPTEKKLEEEHDDD